MSKFLLINPRRGNSLIWMELNRIYLKLLRCKLVESIIYHIFSHTVKLVLVVKNLPFNAGDVRDAGSIPGWGRQPTPVSLHGESHEQRSLVGYSPQGCTELNMTEVT